MQISMMGEGGLLFDFTPVLDVDVQRRIWALARRMEAIKDIREIVPGVGNLLVLFDPLLTDVRSLQDRVRECWEQSDEQAPPGRLHEIGVSYGGEHGIDLDHVASLTGMTSNEVIRRHEGSAFIVAAVGAMPGFPYLLGLDPRLFVPRRSVPRVSVREGSVVIGGGMSGVITRTSASGWHILGRAEQGWFDPQRQPPTLFAPGDRVRFYADTASPAVKPE